MLQVPSTHLPSLLHNGSILLGHLLLFDWRKTFTATPTAGRGHAEATEDSDPLVPGYLGSGPHAIL